MDVECDPAVVGRMGQTVHAVGHTARAHAHSIAAVGFDPAHTGQAYQSQGQTIAAGIADLVAQLHTCADTSSTAAELMRTTPQMLVDADEHTSGRITHINK